MVQIFDSLSSGFFRQHTCRNPVPLGLDPSTTTLALLGTHLQTDQGLLDC